MDGVNDLRAVDPLQVNGRDAEVGVPELTLDDDQWNALMRHLDRVRVAELMGCEPTAHWMSPGSVDTVSLGGLRGR